MNPQHKLIAEAIKRLKYAVGGTSTTEVVNARILTKDIADILEEEDKCKYCLGNGWIEGKQKEGAEQYSNSIKCPKCKGKKFNKTEWLKIVMGEE